MMSLRFFAFYCGGIRSAPAIKANAKLIAQSFCMRTNRKNIALRFPCKKHQQLSLRVRSGLQCLAHQLYKKI